eukprot:6212965-Pleurochrysis_carterae.AAC.2
MLVVAVDIELLKCDDVDIVVEHPHDRPVELVVSYGSPDICRSECNARAFSWISKGGVKTYNDLRFVNEVFFGYLRAFGKRGRGVVERRGPRLEEISGLRLLLPFREGNVRGLLHAVLGRESADAVDLGRVKAVGLDVSDLDYLRGELEDCGVPEGFASGG